MCWLHRSGDTTRLGTGEMTGGPAGNVVPFSPERAGTRRTVLLAWPASPARTALVRALERRGQAVRTADDSHSTLALLERATWYAVLLHEALPDGGGLWVARLLDYARALGSVAESPLILVDPNAQVPEEDWRATEISRCLDGSPGADAILSTVRLARGDLRLSAG